ASGSTGAWPIRCWAWYAMDSCNGWSVDSILHRHHDTSTPQKDRSMNLFVGNLFWETTEADVAQLFEAYGTVERVQIITDRDTGRSRGFGFVEMPNEAEAQEAITDLHGMAHRGRTLTVSEAKPREDRQGRRRPR